MGFKSPARSIAKAFSAAAVVAGSMAAFAPAPVEAQPKFKALMYWQAGDFFHNSTHYVMRVWRTLAAQNGFQLDSANTSAVFTVNNLKQYQAVIWINNTKPGNVLNNDQRAAWFEYIKTGGYLGMHAATDAVGTWPEGGQPPAHHQLPRGVVQLPHQSPPGSGREGALHFG